VPSVPTVPTFTSDVLPTTSLNLLSAAVSFLREPPIAEMYSAVNQSLTTGTWTSLLFELEIVDSVDGHSTSVNTSRYIAVYTGRYKVSGLSSYASNATGQRGTRLVVNGVAQAGAQTSVPPVNGSQTEIGSGSHWVYLNVSDYVEVQGFQSSGGALNTGASAGWTPSMTVGWGSV